MDRDVSTGTNVRTIKTVVYRESALMSVELCCQRSSATVNLDGSVLDVTRVSDD